MEATSVSLIILQFLAYVRSPLITVVSHISVAVAPPTRAFIPPMSFVRGERTLASTPLFVPQTEIVPHYTLSVYKDEIRGISEVVHPKAVVFILKG